MSDAEDRKAKSFAWFKIIALAWLVLISFSQVKRFAPASWWFEITRFNVADGYEKEDPPLLYERQVKSSFNIEIVAYVWKIDGGKYKEACSTYRRDRFETGRELPEVMTVNWMLRPRGCELLEGHYVLQVTWVVKVDSMTTKEVTRDSNIFTISKRPTDG